ncbi:HCO3 transporter family-domain-containing protein [Naematelia encephala]|uniref:HCO3 transporter family-domain-containing protein n=1 Tax=Naematelia encephala TaxID=71784 RepID=A0A1Y2B4C6_9TREE|nr:HCO3 transporter family-domain-containing protein [Naematelia encephala]
MPRPRRTSTSSTTLPHHTSPRPKPPDNPPDPPLTLLHPIRSRVEEFHVPPDGHVKSPDRDREKGTKGWIGWIGSGMRNDIKSRIPWYISDWTDAWNYRVIPSTWFIFFANVLPGIAFSLDLIETTGAYGVQEVLLASFMAAFVASFLGGQPLLISGVTGPITVFNKTIFDIFKGQLDSTQYLHFMGWTYLWGAIFHWIAAFFNAVQGLKYVTRFSCDTFGFYVASVYVQYGIQVVTRQFHQSSTAAAFLGIILALTTLVLPHYFNAVARSGYVNQPFRRFCSDYGMPITIIAMTGLAYWGRFDTYALEENMTLPVTHSSFQPASGRAWLVRFWRLEGKYVGIALPFGLVLFILFYFDANVSSLIAQGSEFPLKKPAAFHWDFFLLGITTFIAGLLGIPAPNGLIPQAPLHTASLVILGYETSSDSSSLTAAAAHGEADEHAIALSDVEEGQGTIPPSSQSTDVEEPFRKDGKSLRRRISQRAKAGKERRMSEGEMKKTHRQVPVAVVEQRVSNLAQGCLCLILMTKPFEHVLGLIPKGVLAGLFWYMGTDALLGSGVTEKMLYLIREARATSPSEPLNNVRKSRIVLFTLIELVGFGATFAITQVGTMVAEKQRFADNFTIQTIAAIGFPVIIMLLVPLRLLIVPRLGFTVEELDILDGPVASPFVSGDLGLF